MAGGGGRMLRSLVFLLLSALIGVAIAMSTDALIELEREPVSEQLPAIDPDGDRQLHGRELFYSDADG